MVLPLVTIKGAQAASVQCACEPRSTGGSVSWCGCVWVFAVPARVMCTKGNECETLIKVPEASEYESPQSRPQCERGSSALASFPLLPRIPQSRAARTASGAPESSMNSED